jgi:hypothetical protein
MPDMTLIQNAVLGLQTAANMAKGLVHLSSMADVQLKVIDLQTSILAAQSSALAAQSEQSMMIQQISQLEKEIAKIKAWEEEKQRYQLIPLREGVFVYALKESCKGSEPPHWICEPCYQEGKKQNLHNATNRGSRTVKCPRCKFEATGMKPCASMFDVNKHFK